MIPEIFAILSSATVNIGALHILDDLDNLEIYNWGVAVYDFLIESLSRAHEILRDGRNSAHVHIVGCAPILQVAIQVAVTNDELEQCGFRNAPSQPTKLDDIRKENESPITSHETDQDGLTQKSCEPPSGHARSMSTRRASHHELLRQLYAYCVYGDNRHDETLVQMFGCYLNRADLRSMKPRGWVSNMVCLLAPKLFMVEELDSMGHLNRYMFTSRLVKQWTSRTVREIIDDSSSLDHLKNCTLIGDKAGSFFSSSSNMSNMFLQYEALKMELQATTRKRGND
ncbi:hypothetical protein SESBI_27260 [Sesbania bispinosa]|nr:hypothetical protein SESBI_27260 [Sesbania bispinosa]